jgi:hypothetical protein
MLEGMPIIVVQLSQSPDSLLDISGFLAYTG